jgi:multiple sugar transport system permease protein
MTGFALSRYSFRGRNIWYIMLILAFILPVPLLTVPRLMIFNQLYTVTGIKLIGSIGPQFIMALLGQGTYSTMLILIFYNFFNMIPKSLDEAAMIDGAGSLKVFYHVAIRLSLSTILVVFLFSFVFNWNETYTTNTMLRNAVELLPVKLSLFDNSSGGVTSSLNEAQKMAATLISIAPLLVLYALVQKQFIQGIENTGITGE